MAKLVKLDQVWYEKAADTIASSTSPEERLASLNEIWSEYCSLASVALELPVEWVREMVNDQLKSATGFTLEEVIEFAKEKIKNGKNETHEATADPE